MGVGKCELQDRQGFIIFLTCCTLYISTHAMFVATVDSTYVDHVVHYTKSTYTIMLLLSIVDCTHVWSATASFKELVTFALENPPTKRQMFWKRICYISCGLGNSFQEQELLKANRTVEHRSFVLLSTSVVTRFITNQWCVR